MKPILLPRVLFVLSVCLVASCQKEISLDVSGQGSSTAAFNIANFESGCPSIFINGHYVNDVALTSNENITVDVEVTKAGHWEFGTSTVNGFSFSGGGTFSNTGKQVIVLNGMGKPLSPGNYNFSTPGTAGDGFLIRVLNHDAVEETVGSDSYFKVSFVGQDYNVPAQTQGPNDIPYGFGPGDTANFTSFMMGGDYPNIPAPGTVSLQKNGMPNFYGSSDADFKNFFKPGAYPITNFNPCNSFLNGTTGILLTLSDSNEDSWSTINGTANQEGSSFAIVGIEDGYNNAGNYFVKVKSRFNLKLYSHQTGEMRELTNGEMVSYFIKPL